MTTKSHKKGFSLIELLAVIFIISLLFGIGGYYIFNTISNSQDKSYELALANVKTTARYYIEEYPEEIIWTTEEETGNRTSCIAVSELINKGYLKSSDLTSENLNEHHYVIITKDTNNNIISEEIDDSGICGNINKSNIVEIPTSKACNTLTYNGGEQTLIDNNTIYYNFSNNKATNAGSYSVIAKLKEGYTWPDGSTNDKTVICFIKKAIPELSLSEQGMDSTVIGSLTTILQSNVPGTIQLRSSNKEYVTATVIGNTHINPSEQKEIEIQNMSSRNSASYVTITLTPDDNKNYYNSSIIYTVAKITHKEIAVPVCKADLVYNKNEQSLINTDNLVNTDIGYQPYGYQQKDAGTYDVVVKLKYGYIWKDGSTEDKTLKCEIKKATPKFSLSPSSGNIDVTKSITTTASSSVPGNVTPSYNSTYVKSITISPKNPTEFNIEITGNTNGTNSTSITMTFTPADSKNYNKASATYNLKINNKFTVTYDNNGGIGCEQTTVTYGNTYGNLCTPTRTGYTFNGWYTAASGGAQITSSTSVTTAINHTLYARWTANKYKLTYNNNGGTGCSEQLITYGKKYGTLCTPTRSGYIFRGWYTATGGGSQVTSDTIAYGAATVYAHWEQITCTVSYDGTKGNNGWYKGYGKVQLNITGLNDNEIQSKGLSKDTSKPTNGTTAINIIEDTTGTQYNGYVLATNGQAVTCNQTIKIDVTPPKITAGTTNCTETSPCRSNAGDLKTVSAKATDTGSGIVLIQRKKIATNNTPGYNQGDLVSDWSSYGTNCQYNAITEARCTSDTVISNGKILWKWRAQDTAGNWSEVVNRYVYNNMG